MRVREERGVALILVILVLAALAAGLTAAIAVSSAAGRTDARSDASQKAYNLAEAGINAALAALHGTGVNALSSTALPSQSSPEVDTYRDGTDTWYGSLDSTTLVWTITSTGQVANPTGPGTEGTAPVTRTITANVNVTFDFSQALNAQAWNYLYSTHTGSTCDQQLQNTVVLQASLFVEGNLCTYNQSAVMPASAPPSPPPAVNLVVKGTVTTNQSSHVGASGSPIGSAAVVGGCNGHNPCKWNGGGDPVWATSTSTTAPSISPPSPNWTYWYANAIPGPDHPCQTSSGTPPTFDDDTTQFDGTGGNGSAYPVSAPFDLTPSSVDYGCVDRDGAGNLLGELVWDHSTQTLTVNGAIYIDGSVTIGSSLSSYVGQGTLYVSGVFSMAGQAQFCGAIANGTCDFGAWNPNTTMLIVVAHGNDGSGNSISLNQSAYFEGGLEATNNITVGQSSIFEGPMVGSSLIFANSVTAKPFPVIDSVPIGTPGNPNLYADAQNPTNYSG